MRPESLRSVAIGIIGFLVIVIIIIGLYQLGKQLFQLRSPNVTAGTTAVAGVSNHQITAVLDIINNPGVYIDVDVIVRDEVNSWVAKNGFIFEEHQGLLNRRTLLVMRKKAFSPPQKTPGTELSLGETRQVEVKGKVKIFDRPTLERVWQIELLPTTYDGWNGQPVILADSITIL